MWHQAINKNTSSDNLQITVFQVVLFACGSYFRGVCSTNKPAPNIIMIMVDDLGWNDVDWRANTDIQTPYLNTLATGVNGVDLQHYYTAPTCGPSRAQFLSG